METTYDLVQALSEGFEEAYSICDERRGGVLGVFG